MLFPVNEAMSQLLCLGGMGAAVLALFWGSNSLFSLTLGLSAIELYTFQDLSSALLVRRD